MEYTNLNGYLVPNLSSRQPAQELGRFGRMRKTFLQENAPILFDQMKLEGILFQNLLKTEQAVREQIAQTVQTLASQNPGPNKMTDPLGWTQWMNGLNMQAEELAMPMLYEL